jgi:pilus assembly protein CpaF
VTDVRPPGRTGNGDHGDLRRLLADLDAEPTHTVDAGSRDIQRQLRARVLEEAGTRIPRSLPDDEREKRIRELLDEIIEVDDIRVSPTQRRTIIRQVVSDTLGYGPLDELMQDDSVSEIMCNGADTIYVERSGLIERTDLAFGDDAHLRSVINRIARSAGRRVDESSPMVDARMPDGSRMNAILPPLARNGPVLTIRRFPDLQLTPGALVELGTYTPDLVAVIEACVRARLNIVVSGGTSTGKTTALNVLSLFIGQQERVITIEDSAELQLSQPHVISLEARPANTEGEGQVTIRDLLANALRMRPDRLIIGECRGGEALDMLQAMNTGHEGSMTTVHANSARDALRRLETMVLMAGYDLPLRAIREQMSAIVHLVLQLDRASDGRRIIRSLSEVQHMEEDTILVQDLFVFDHETHRPVRTGLRPSFLPLLERAGVAYPAPPGEVSSSGGR